MILLAKGIVGWCEMADVHEVKNILILAGQLDSQGCRVTFKFNRWKVTKGVLVIFRGTKLGSLHLLEIHTEVGAVKVIADSDLEL